MSIEEARRGSVQYEIDLASPYETITLNGDGTATAYRFGQGLVVFKPTQAQNTVIRERDGFVRIRDTQILRRSSVYYDPKQVRDASDCDHTHPPSVPTGPCPPGGDPSAFGAPAQETAQVIFESGAAHPTPLKKKGCLPEVRLEKSPSFEACMKEKRKLGPIDGPKKVHALCAPRIGTADQEHFLVVLLDVRQHLKGVYTAAKGQQSHVAVGIQDVMKVVLDSRAAAFTVVHNHPTGNPKPSDQDRKLTREIAKATKPYGRDVTFVDHVVIGTGTRYYSLREREPKLFDV